MRRVLLIALALIVVGCGAQPTTATSTTGASPSTAAAPGTASAGTTGTTSTAPTTTEPTTTTTSVPATTLPTALAATPQTVTVVVTVTVTVPAPVTAAPATTAAPRPCPAGRPTAKPGTTQGTPAVVTNYATDSVVVEAVEWKSFVKNPDGSGSMRSGGSNPTRTLGVGASFDVLATGPWSSQLAQARVADWSWVDPAFALCPTPLDPPFT